MVRLKSLFEIAGVSPTWVSLWEGTKVALFVSVFQQWSLLSFDAFHIPVVESKCTRSHSTGSRVQVAVVCQVARGRVDGLYARSIMRLPPPASPPARGRARRFSFGDSASEQVGRDFSRRAQSFT